MILALDYGEKRIGVAVSDESHRFAKALDYLPNKSEPKKIFAKDFPKGTAQTVINDARRLAKRECKTEFRKLCNKLVYIINLYYPEIVLIGLPTIVDLETQQPVLGPQAKKITEFAKKLDVCLKQNKILLEIKFVEESMTSMFAEKNLREQGLTNDKIREHIDSESARILLEGYLSSI